MPDMVKLFAQFFAEAPLFFNEADMANQFARFIASQYDGVDIHMEVFYEMPTCVSGLIKKKPISFDLVLVIKDRIIAIEMKYKTRIRNILHDGIIYHLKNHSSQNLTRYDVWYDLERCEFILTQNIPLIKQQPTEAYAIIYTNDHLLWESAENTMSSDLPLCNGSYPAQDRKIHASGDTNDVPTAGSVGAFRLNHVINITNGYDFRWKDAEYGFRYLLIGAKAKVGS